MNIYVFSVHAAWIYGQIERAQGLELLIFVEFHSVSTTEFHCRKDCEELPCKIACEEGKTSCRGD